MPPVVAPGLRHEFENLDAAPRKNPPPSAIRPLCPPPGRIRVPRPGRNPVPLASGPADADAGPSFDMTVVNAVYKQHKDPLRIACWDHSTSAEKAYLGKANDPSPPRAIVPLLDDRRHRRRRLGVRRQADQEVEVPAAERHRQRSSCRSTCGTDPGSGLFSCACALLTRLHSALHSECRLGAGEARLHLRGGVIHLGDTLQARRYPRIVRIP